MSLAISSESLLGLAKSRQPADRERLLLAIADLCDAPNGGEALTSATIQALLSSIFMSLVVEAERDIRQRLSEKLSDAEWAPSALVNVLALDDIEIARPIIARSPVLKDLDLVRLLVEATIEHQIEVARRPHISRAVVSAILEKGEPEVLTALAGNHSAELTAHDMAELVEMSRRIAAMRTPLSDHPKLTDALATRLYLWVGVALRQGLADRFQFDVAALDETLAATIAEAEDGVETKPPVNREAEREAMEMRLVDKLHAAGQLRPGYLVRALREERLAQFIGGLALLGKFEPAEVKATLNSERPELLALACAAVGIDRSVFPDILEMTRQLNNGKPGGGASGTKSATVAFAPVTAEIAAVSFRAAARALLASSGNRAA